MVLRPRQPPGIAPIKAAKADPIVGITAHFRDLQFLSYAGATVEHRSGNDGRRFAALQCLSCPSSPRHAGYGKTIAQPLHEGTMVVPGEYLEVVIVTKWPIRRRSRRATRRSCGQRDSTVVAASIPNSGGRAETIAFRAGL